MYCQKAQGLPYLPESKSPFKYVIILHYQNAFVQGKLVKCVTVHYAGPNLSRKTKILVNLCKAERFSFVLLFNFIVKSLLLESFPGQRSGSPFIMGAINA